MSQYHRQITHDPFSSLSGISDVQVIDNGLKVYSSDFDPSIDQEGRHYAVGCLPGYIYTFKQDRFQPCKFP